MRIQNYIKCLPFDGNINDRLCLIPQTLTKPEQISVTDILVRECSKQTVLSVRIKRKESVL